MNNDVIFSAADSKNENQVKVVQDPAELVRELEKRGELGRMGHSNDGESCLVDVDAREDGGDTFACPYCPEIYETREKRDRCQASHFQDTENISRPRSDRTRHRNKNIVEDWRENKGEA